MISSPTTMQELRDEAQDWQWYHEAHGENWSTVEWAFEIVDALLEIERST